MRRRRQGIVVTTEAEPGGHTFLCEGQTAARVTGLVVVMPGPGSFIGDVAFAAV